MRRRNEGNIEAPARKPSVALACAGWLDRLRLAEAGDRLLLCNFELQQLQQAAQGKYLADCLPRVAEADLPPSFLHPPVDQHQRPETNAGDVFQALQVEDEAFPAGLDQAEKMSLYLGGTEAVELSREGDQQYFSHPAIRNCHERSSFSQ